MLIFDTDISLIFDTVVCWLIYVVYWLMWICPVL